MAHHSIPEPEQDLPQPDPASLLRGGVADTDMGGEPADVESDFTRLATRFASPEGGHLAPELSADLALEVVLNEIVEQACLATGATGAAIILQREGEMVCRASSGTNAPELGARLGGESGLTAACIMTRQMQHCDDTQDDARADAEACLYLGVRSVMILPLLRGAELAGVFEVFSSHPAAFGERDQRTLEALSQRVLRSLAQAAKPLPAPVEVAPAAETMQNTLDAYLPVDNLFAEDALPESATEEPATQKSETSTLAEPTSLDETLLQDADGENPPANRGMNVITWIFAAAVFAFAAFLIVVGAARFTARKSARALPRPNISNTLNHAEKQSESSTRTASGTQTIPAESSSKPVADSASSLAAAPAQPRRSLPPGSLGVYQNGKEIFRLPPTAEQAETIPASDAKQGDANKESRPFVVEPAAIFELSPDAAEGSLLFRVEPEYPAEARRQQIQGPVVLDVRAGRDGAVQKVKLVSGQPLLADAAISAVKQWRFKPHSVKGQPVEMQTKVTLNFRLPR